MIINFDNAPDVYITSKSCSKVRLLIHYSEYRLTERRYGQTYCARLGNRLLPSHDRALKDILRCRTQKAGGQIYECPERRELSDKYHSCMKI